jgi:hypothetical protein
LQDSNNEREIDGRFRSEKSTGKSENPTAGSVEREHFAPKADIRLPSTSNHQGNKPRVLTPIPRKRRTNDGI